MGTIRRRHALVPMQKKLAGLGTTFLLAVTAMAATTPIPVVVPAEAPPAGPAVTAATAGVGPARKKLSQESRPSASPEARPEAATPSAPGAEAEPPGPPVAQVVDGHLGGRELAVALAASGRQITTVTRQVVVDAATDLGVDLDDPITIDDVAALTVAAWAQAPHQWALAAIGPGEAPDLSDIREAAARFGVEVSDPLGPVDVSAVLAAGRADAGKALSAVGVNVGETIDIADYEAAAQKLGVDYGKVIEPEDAKLTVWKAKDKVQRQWEAKHPTPAFATAAGVVLRLPSHRVEYAGFHQAAYPGVITMNKGGKARTEVLPSRGRATSRASAIDIVQAPGEDVRAPVTGRVAEVTSYALYGKYADIRMRIVPSDNPHTIVTVLHVEGAKVKPGDKVEAGMTVIADGPRKFPFASQIDRFAGRDWGHVHLEIRNR